MSSLVAFSASGADAAASGDQQPTARPADHATAARPADHATAARLTVQAAAARLTDHAPAARLSGHAAAARTVVSFTFDDGDADQMAAAQVLHRYGMNGTFYISSGAVGSPSYVTLSDLYKLAAQGDEIGGHTVSHLELPHISAAEARRQVCGGRDTLLKWGFHVTSFAYPGGAYSPGTEVIAGECGFNSARTVAGLRSPGCPRCTVAETIPPAHRYAIRVPGQVDGSWTLATMKDVVTTAEQHGGGWLPLIFHHMCDTNRCSSLSVRVSRLSAFAKWLAQRRDIGTVVKTVGQVVGGPFRPMVATAAVRRHGVINPSLDTLSNSGAVDPIVEAPSVSAPFPLCWLKASYGQNMTTWQRIEGGHASRWAMRLTMTSHRSGDAKLIQQFDLGQCSIPVTADQSYNLAAWFKSSTRTQFSIYYRTPQGRFLYWTSSPFFPATTQWAKASYTTPPLPAGASGLSFGLALSRPGSLITDQYSIVATPRSVTRGILDVALLALVLGGGVAGARAWRRGRRAASRPLGRAGKPQPERRKDEGVTPSSSNP